MCYLQHNLKPRLGKPAPTVWATGEWICAAGSTGNWSSQLDFLVRGRFNSAPLMMAGLVESAVLHGHRYFHSGGSAISCALTGCGNSTPQAAGAPEGLLKATIVDT